jgi:hypothetical protein
MSRILGFALLSILFSALVMAAQNSQTFYPVTPARAGNIQLPRGIYEVHFGCENSYARRDVVENEWGFNVASK